MTLVDDDCRTRVWELPSSAPWTDATRLLARAVNVLPFLPREGSRAGYRLFTSSDRTVSFCDVIEGGHAVVGRHSGADIVLAEPGIALRQLVVSVARDEDGRLELRVHDLRTELSFFVGPDWMPRRAVAARGPVTLRVGSSAIFALPLVGCLPRGEHSDPAAVAYAQAHSDAGEHLDADYGVPVVGEADLFDAAARTVVRPLARFVELPKIDASWEPAWVRLELRGPKRRLRIDLSQLQLAAPLLVGRYARCEGHGRPVFSPEVSRVHAAVFRDGDSIVVRDLASTNGLELDGCLVRAARVGDRAVIGLSARDRLVVQVTGFRGRV